MNQNHHYLSFFGEKNPSIEVQASLEHILENEIEDIKFKESGIDKEALEKIKTNVDLNVINITDKGEKEGDVALATGVGYVSALLIYFFIFLYARSNYFNENLRIGGQRPISYTLQCVIIHQQIRRCNYILKLQRLIMEITPPGL